MKIIILILSVTGLIILLFFLFSNNSSNSNFTKVENQVTQSKRPVIFLMIDSLMDEPLQKAMKEKRVPALEFLIQNGQYYPNVVSSYPTMSVTIDSTLLTGTYPDHHNIPGLVWYDEKEKRIVNYGSGKKEIVALGTKQVLKDILYHLNNQHLSKSVTTIHEELEKNKKHSASINGLIYRGDYEQTLDVPKPISFFRLLPKQLKTNGPILFSFGRFSQFDPNNRYNHFWQNVGFNDHFSAQEVKYLIQKKKLPAFTIAYLPSNDHTVHKNGPMAIKGIEKADKQLQNILNSYDSWDEALKKAVWIVMGDSGQSPIGKDKNQSLISLNSLLQNYRISKLGEPIKENDQIVLAVNERMAFIYTLDHNISFSEIASKLKHDSRIGFIAWKENDWIHVANEKAKDTFQFRPNGKFTDPYNQSWTLEGDASILDLAIKENNIQYGNYPDALARLYSSFHSHNGRYLIVDAKPGHEFVSEKSPTHIGGAAHGSLHKQDSLVPMIVVGTDARPQSLRQVDLKDYFLQLTQ
ncbi:alkaline phosphatase family protein [Bacillus smithii]|uniref:alkaline phosphatase family protein n=1 Tax=Bacillus smithii TaxID=1479 RepID=UPI0030ECA581